VFGLDFVLLDMNLLILTRTGILGILRRGGGNPGGLELALQRLKITDNATIRLARV